MKLNEPFFVEKPHRLFQQLNPPPVVLDQIVVGGKGGSDGSLCSRIARDLDWKPVQVISIYTWNRRFVTVPLRQYGLQKVCRKSWIVAFEVADVERCIQRPEAVRDEKYFSQRSVATSDYPRASTLATLWWPVIPDEDTTGTWPSILLADGKSYPLFKVMNSPSGMASKIIRLRADIHLSQSRLHESRRWCCKATGSVTRRTAEFCQPIPSGSPRCASCCVRLRANTPSHVPCDRTPRESPVATCRSQ